MVPLVNCVFSPSETIGQSDGLANHRLLSDAPQNETPAALAGATGANDVGQVFKTEHYRNRAEAATNLCLAIANCAPQDAMILMAAALADLAGQMMA